MKKNKKGFFIKHRVGLLSDLSVYMDERTEPLKYTLKMQRKEVFQHTVSAIFHAVSCFDTQLIIPTSHGYTRDRFL